MCPPWRDKFKEACPRAHHRTQRCQQRWMSHSSYIYLVRATVKCHLLMVSRGSFPSVAQTRADIFVCACGSDQDLDAVEGTHLPSVLTPPPTSPHVLLCKGGKRKRRRKDGKGKGPAHNSTANISEYKRKMPKMSVKVRRGIHSDMV